MHLARRWTFATHASATTLGRRRFDGKPGRV
jgi:hypothetical protein